MTSLATDNLLFLAKKDTISCDLEGEAVLMQLGSGTYFGLNAIGAEIWKFIQEKQSLEAIRRHLLTLYDVTNETCEAEVSAFLEQMLQQGLVETYPNASDQ